MSTAPPWIAAPNRWVNTREFARLYKRTQDTVEYWCRTGQLAAFGIRSHKDINGRWFIELPDGMTAEAICRT